MKPPRVHRRRPWAHLALALVAAGLLAASATAEAQQWQSVGTKNGVKVWRKEVTGTNKFAFRGELVADVHIARVLATFGDPGSRRHWVDRWSADRELDVRSKLERTYWIRFGLPFPVSDRDYVLHTKADVYPDKRHVIARIRSVNHPSKGEDDCCVRGEVAQTYYRFEALPGSEKTRLIVEVQTDPRGMLPGWLVNMIQKDWPVKTLTGLVAAARRPTVTPAADYADWHTPPAPAAPAAPAAAPTP